MKTALTSLALLLLTTALTARAADNPYNLPDGLYAEIPTTKGMIVGELFYKKVPLTVASFVGLAEGTIGPKKGVPFFENMRFFRVDFVIETGDERVREAPFADEMVPGLRHDSLGVMQMANAGPDTNGSYWCFMLEETPRLNYLHTVFGHVVRGIDVLPKIVVGDTFSVKILRIGTEAEAYKVDEASFAALAAKAKKYNGPREPGPDAFFDDPDKQLPAAPAGRGRGPTNPRARDINFRLAKFQLFAGQIIKARVLAKIPEGLDDPAKMTAYMDALAEKLGMADTGALAVYFADKDQWQIRIGKESQPSFIAGPRKADGTKEPTAPGKTLTQAMSEFQAETKKAADAYIAKDEKAAPAGQPVATPQKIKLKVDAVVDALFFRLEPAAK